MADKKAEPEAHEPILILGEDSFSPEPFEGPHSCSKCGKKVQVYETVGMYPNRGYCSVNCYITR